VIGKLIYELKCWRHCPAFPVMILISIVGKSHGWNSCRRHTLEYQRVKYLVRHKTIFRHQLPPQRILLNSRPYPPTTQFHRLRVIYRDFLVISFQFRVRIAICLSIILRPKCSSLEAWLRAEPDSSFEIIRWAWPFVGCSIRIIERRCETESQRM